MSVIHSPSVSQKCVGKFDNETPLPESKIITWFSNSFLKSFKFTYKLVN